MTLPVDRPLRVLVLTPAYNEEDMVGIVVRQILKLVDNADVVVVDDGSTDRTAEVARRSGAQVLPLPYNLGVGGAMRAGYRFAHRAGYDAVVQIDADGQHDPADVPLLLDGLAEADIVIGARFAGRGDFAVTGVRRWAMRYLARRVSGLAGTRLDDVTSGFRAFGPRAITVFARHYPAEYLGDTVEALVIAAKRGLVIRQVPVAMRQREGGVASQTTPRAALYTLRAIAVTALARFQRWPVAEDPAPWSAYDRSAS